MYKVLFKERGEKEERGKKKLLRDTRKVCEVEEGIIKENPNSKSL